MLTMGPNSAQQCLICCIPETHLDAIDVTFSHHDMLICRETYEMVLLALMETESAKPMAFSKLRYVPGPMDCYTTYF